MPRVDSDRWQVVSPHLDEALDLAEHERAAWLLSLRERDPALAADVETMLQQHDDGFLEAAVQFTGSRAVAGARVGAYTLLSPIGQGGMGTVWLAERSDGRFDRRVAIKFLNQSLVGGADRFRREGRMLARLEHRHIAQLLDAGVSEGGVAPAGQPFLVLEYVEGKRLDHFARDERLDIPARLNLFVQVADAVAHAHANLVVHRDLKPSNILVNAAGQVKLLDFGIGRLLDEGREQEPGTITVAAGRALTPVYAAPEQVTTGGMTTATDVYALGVLLYELLVGRHPTASKARTEAEVVRALLEDDPLPPSDVARKLRADDPDGVRILEERRTTAHRLQRACRGDLDVIVGQALKKYPDERYRTVADFAADVRRHLNNEPVLAQADAWRYRARKFVSRHRLEVAAAFVVALALAAGTGIAMRQASVSAAERDRALASLRRAEATNDLSAFLLSEARPAGKPISNAELLARGEAVVQTRYSDADDLKVHLLLTLADRYQENQQFNEMTRVVGQAYDASRQLTDRALRAYATCYSSFPLVERGDFKGALVILDQALTELSTAPDASEYEGACRVMESVAARRGGDGARAIRAAERAVAIEERGAGSGRRVQEALLALAAAYAFDLRHGAAAATYQRLVSIFEAEGRADTANAAVMFNNWSTGLQDAGLPLQAVGPSERAVRTARAADSENGASMTLLNTYATALVAVGRYDEARPLLDEAIVKARKAGAPPRLRLLLSNAATAAAEAGEIERAQRLAAEAASLSRSPSERAIAQRTEATLAEVSGRRRDAAQLAGRAFEMLTAAGASKVTRMRTQIDLARIQNGDGQFADALTAAESALAAAKDALGDLPRSSHVGRALLEIAAARCGLGDTATARSTLSLALDHLQSTTGTQSAATRRAEAVRRALDQNVPGCTP